jgi:arabinose-5-phosphate isomerase
LEVGVEQEPCPLQLAPTASTTATLAMGDALAVTLMKARNFKPESFARFHPGVMLGRRLLSRVENEMVTANLFFLESHTCVAEIITTIKKSGIVLAIIVEKSRRYIIADGDLRRAIEKFRDQFFTKTARDLMVVFPVTVRMGARIEEALRLMEVFCITSVLVTDSQRIDGVFKKLCRRC